MHLGGEGRSFCTASKPNGLWKGPLDIAPMNLISQSCVLRICTAQGAARISPTHPQSWWDWCPLPGELVSKSVSSAPVHLRALCKAGSSHISHNTRPLGVVQPSPAGAFLSWGCSLWSSTNRASDAAQEQEGIVEREIVTSTLMPVSGPWEAQPPSYTVWLSFQLCLLPPFSWIKWKKRK